MTKVTQPTREALEQRKRANVLQLLFKCARLANERAMARVNREAGRPLLKGAHTALLPHLSYEGTRVVELARKLEISKQAVSQTLAEMIAAGVVEFVPDPRDGRAKLARLTERGARSIADGLAVLEALEGEFAQEVGDERMRGLHDGLLALERVLAAG